MGPFPLCKSPTDFYLDVNQHFKLKGIPDFAAFTAHPLHVTAIHFKIRSFSFGLAFIPSESTPGTTAYSTHRLANRAYILIGAPRSRLDGGVKREPFTLAGLKLSPLFVCIF